MIQQHSAPRGRAFPKGLGVGGWASQRHPHLTPTRIVYHHVAGGFVRRGESRVRPRPITSRITDKHQASSIIRPHPAAASPRASLLRSSGTRMKRARKSATSASRSARVPVISSSISSSRKRAVRPPASIAPVSRLQLGHACVVAQSDDMQPARVDRQDRQWLGTIQQRQRAVARLARRPSGWVVVVADLDFPLIALVHTVAGSSGALERRDAAVAQVAHAQPRTARRAVAGRRCRSRHFAGLRHQARRRA